jgi:hypothetical protein
MTGEATLAVTNAPVDGTCLRVTVAGSRTVTSSFDLVAGQNTLLTLHGLPLGNDTFTEEAFGGTCSAVGPSTIANWVSEPVTSFVQGGVVSNVTIVLHRNGQVNLTSDFQDDPGPGCGAIGSACTTDSQCCTGNVCTAGVCAQTCPAPQQLCTVSGALQCTDVSSNVSNCGSCGTVCAPGANGVPTCAAGVCSLVCAAGFANCNGQISDGCESALNTQTNCGFCGHVCPTGTACSAGTCTPTGGGPHLTLSSSSIVFPSTPLGSNSQFPLTGTNTGSSTLVVNSAIISGPNPGDFTLMGGTVFPLMLAPGASMNVTIRFAPTLFGTRNATLNISSNDATTPNQQVALSGSGIL